MAYFKTFPHVLYDFSTKLDKEDLITKVQDILVRSSLYASAKDITAMTMPYYIREGETPEIVAHRAYGNTDLHWTVMFINGICDVYSEFPLSSPALNEYCIKKYGIENLDKVHHWERLPEMIEVGRVVYTNGVIDEDKSGLIFFTQNRFRYANPEVSDTANPEDKVTELYDTYEYTTYTNLEHEINENDYKRHIRIIRPEFIANFVFAFMKNIV